VSKRRAVAGGAVAVEVPPDRLVGWVNRFAGRNDGLTAVTTDGLTVTMTGGDGTEATIDVPFGPMTVDDAEPVEALLAHLAALGALGLILVRGGAHSVGVARAGIVLSSSTDRAYLQGRTAAGGWSQQRFARRRDNQRAASYDSAATTAARILIPIATSLTGLVLGGDRRALADVLADSRLAGLAGLPVRTFPDIPEPRRAVLDDIAARSLSVEIVIRAAP
jgi:hypothetical protein